MHSDGCSFALTLIIGACVSPGTEGMWAFSQDLTAILVKQEPNLLSEPSPGPAATMPSSSSATQPITLNPPPQRHHNHDKVGREQSSSTVPTIKAEPREVNQFLSVPT
ncbi:cyclic AMP-responsive element-binding protein 3-like protein 1 isoform X1, partial [Tachysurus ichikawai]